MSPALAACAFVAGFACGALALGPRILRLERERRILMHNLTIARNGGAA